MRIWFDIIIIQNQSKGGLNIGTRERDPRLQKLFDEKKHVYSFSKLSSIENCPYGAYLNYIIHQKNRRQSVWGILGGKFHDKLEEITLGKADKSELKPLVEKEFENLDILGLDFPKDAKGGDSIRQNWAINMQHFSDNFIPLKGDFSTEELLILKVDDDHYLQGYADLIRHNDDGTLSILDWKSSSLYDKKGFEHAAHQLRIYGLAEEQAGNKVKDLAWIFMKYVVVEYIGKKKATSKKETLIEKVIERRKLGVEMKAKIESDLFALGYDDIDIDLKLSEMEQINSLEKLPAEIQNKYTIKPYIKVIPFDEEGKKTTWEYIKNTISDFESRSPRNEDEWEPRKLTRFTRQGKEVEDTFFCNALCDFGETCKFIQAFNSEFNNKDDDFDEWF